MKEHVQAALAIVAALYFTWSVAFLVAPEETARLLAAGAAQSSVVALLAAALMGLALLFLFASHEPQETAVQASAAALAVLALVVGYQMFIARALPMLPGMMSLPKSWLECLSPASSISVL